MVFSWYINDIIRFGTKEMKRTTAPRYWIFLDDFHHKDSYWPKTTDCQF